MKLCLALCLAAATASLGGCAEKSDKPKEKIRRTTAGSAAAGSGSGSGSAKVTGSAAEAGAPTGTTAPVATVAEARPKLVASLEPIAAGIEEAMKAGCMLGADKVAAMFRDADDAADDLHVMMRDPELRKQLGEAIKARMDKPLAKALSRIDTALVGCPNAAEQMRKGMDRLLQPAVVVPQ